MLFIDAVHEVARERAQSFLKPEHQERIESAYQVFADEPGFAKVATIEGILEKDANLSIPLLRATGKARRRATRATTIFGAPGQLSTPAAMNSGWR